MSANGGGDKGHEPLVRAPAGLDVPETNWCPGDDTNGVMEAGESAQSGEFKGQNKSIIWYSRREKGKKMKEEKKKDNRGARISLMRCFFPQENAILVFCSFLRFHTRLLVIFSPSCLFLVSFIQPTLSLSLSLSLSLCVCVCVCVCVCCGWRSTRITFLSLLSHSSTFSFSFLSLITLV